MGADLRRRGGDFIWRPHGLNPTANHLRFGGELALIVVRSGHDRTAIVVKLNRCRPMELEEPSR